MNAISILVADDSSETREVLAYCLTEMGHDVTCASGGLEAMSLLEDRVFDLIITDVLMPDADGIQVVIAARKYQPHAHLVAMTGGGDFFGSRELLKLARVLGAEDQLSKPFSRAQLVDVIERACSRPALAGAA